MPEEHVIPAIVAPGYPITDPGHYATSTCTCRPTPEYVMNLNGPSRLVWRHNPIRPPFPSQENPS